MRTAQIFTSWLVNCLSPEAAQALWRRLSKDIHLDAVVQDLVRSREDGAERRQVKAHRLGDYFADIRVLPLPGNGTTAFRLVFQRLPNAGRFWKDLMVNIIEVLQSAPETSSITLDYKGDKAPLEAAETPR